MFNHAIDFMRGATMMAELGVALFFFKYWKETADKLFLFFSCAFVILAISQKTVLFLGDDGEYAPYAYYLRVGAFILILLGILGKNIPMKNSNK